MIKPVQAAKLDKIQRFRLNNLSAAFLGVLPFEYVYIFYDTEKDCLCISKDPKFSGDPAIEAEA